MTLFKDNRYEVLWDGISFFNYDSTGQELGKLGDLSESADLSESTIATSVFRFEVFNANDVFSKFIYDKLNTVGKTIFNDIVKVYKIADDGTRHQIYKGYVRSISPSNSLEISYSISLESIVGKLKGKVWFREFSEYLNETIDNINAHRLSSGFTMTTYAEGGETKRRITFRGHILDCFKGLLEMRLSNPDIEVNKAFLDTNYLDFLDMTSFNSVKNSLNASMYDVTFIFDEPINNLFEFLQSQIFQAVAVLPSVNPEGKIRIAIHQQPTQQQGIVGFNDSSIIKYNSKGIDNSNIVNNILVNYEYKNEKFQKSFLKIDSNSFKFFGNTLHPESPLTLELKSLNGQNSGVVSSFVNALTDTMFSRFSREVNKLSIKVPIQLAFNNVSLGDFVAVASDNIIDWENGTRGLGVSKDLASTDCILGTDYWGGFIKNNSIGVYQQSATEVVDTKSEIVTQDLFRGNAKSLKTSQADFDKWLQVQGV